MLANIIGGFIVILVGVNLIPTIATSISMAQNFNSTGAGTSNIQGASSTLLGLVTLFFALAIMTSAVGIAAIGLRQAGLLGR